MSGYKSRLGPVQKKVLELLTNDTSLTIRQIASRRKTTPKAVYNIITKLRKKGVLKGSSFRGFNLGAPCNCMGVQSYDLHAQRFVVEILGFVSVFSQQQYFGKVSNCGVSFRGQTVKLRSKVVEIYSVRRFKGSSLNVCEEASCNYWNVFLEGLQNKYGVVLMKRGFDNIRESYCEVAMLRNGIAYNQNVLRDRIYYFDENTGKLWLQTDKSFRGDDLEFMGKSAKSSARLFEPHLTCWKDPNQATPKELQTMVAGLINIFTQQQNLNSNVVTKKKDRDLPSYFG